MICLKCKKEYNEIFASGRFCSISCSNSREIIGNKIIKCKHCNVEKEVKKNCKNEYVCNNCFFIDSLNNDYKCKCCGNKKNNKKNIYCSVKCYRIDKPNPISDEIKEKLSKIAKERNLGGVNQSKKILYKGKYLGSSYELKLAIDLDKNNIKWDVCEKIKYKDLNNKIRTYTPDIFLIDFNIYLDPKNDFLLNNNNPSLGFKDVDKIKWVMEQNNIKVFILNKNQLYWNYIKKHILKI